MSLSDRSQVDNGGCRTSGVEQGASSPHFQFGTETRIESEAAWESAFNATLAELATMIVSTDSIEDLSAAFLDRARRLTDSPLGYVGFIDEVTGWLVCPTMTRDVWNMCRVANKDIVFKEFGGLWGWVLRNRLSVLTNDATNDPRSVGTPAGHVPIFRFLSAPAIEAGGFVGQIALANAERDYTERDLRVVERLASMYTLAVERHRTTARLRTLEKAAQQSIDGIVVIDLEGVVTYVNGAWAKAHHHSPTSLTGKSLSVFHTAEQYETQVKPALAVLKDRGFYEGEVGHVDREGRTFTMAMSATTIVDERGAPVGYIGVARDIAAQKQAEEQLKASRHFIERVLKATPNLIYIYDLIEQRHIYRNFDIGEVLGYDTLPKEAMGKDFPDHVVHPHDLPKLTDHRRGFADVSEGQVLEVEFRLRHADGMWRVYRSRDTLFSRTAEGHPRQIIGVAMDVTGLRRAEQALRDSEARFRMLYEDAPLAYQSLDETGHILDVNNAWMRSLGYTRREVIGRWFGELLPPAEAGRFEVSFNRYLSEGEMHGAEWTLVRKDGSRLIASFEGRVAHDNEGRFRWIQNIFHDITDRKRMEEEQDRLNERLRKAQQMESLTVLAGGVAHDFNNLLVGILGNASLLLADQPADSPLRESIELIEISARRAAELTQQMLAYSGKGTFVLRPLDLTRLVEDMAHLFHATMQTRGELVLKCRQNLPMVEADSGQIRQLLMNLVINAAEALEGRRGKVTIRTDVVDADRTMLSDAHMDDNLPEGRYVFLAVEDTGVGMDDATLARVFDPFFSTKFVGRGLGLPATLGIVRGHHGAIRVRSVSGKGTIVTVLLPSVTESEPTVSAPSPATTSRSWQATGTVLVVDDEETVLIVARRILQKAGFTVLTASGGREAVETFRQYKNDIRIILLDLSMPDLSGEEVFRMLRRISRNVKVLLSSGYSLEEVVQRFSGRRPAGFIHKPYDPPALIEALRNILEA